MLILMRNHLVPLLFALAAFGGCGGVNAEGAPFSNTLHACAAGGAADCTRLEDDLEALFTGGSTADRAVATRLASAASRLLADQMWTTRPSSSGQRTIDEVLRACRTDDAQACNRFARVLSGLFSGADARLDASPDRLLARAVASRLSSDASP